MDKTRYSFCGSNRHKFGKLVLRGAPVIKDKKKRRGFQRAYQECIKELCLKVVELKRDIWVNVAGEVVKTGKWQEDTKYKLEKE